MNAKWVMREPALIPKQDFIEAHFSACRRLELQRTRELPYGEVLINPGDRDNARLEDFYNHLLDIGLADDDEEVLEAIEFFVRFRSEYCRLIREGEIL